MKTTKANVIAECGDQIADREHLFSEGELGRTDEYSRLRDNLFCTRAAHHGEESEEEESILGEMDEIWCLMTDDERKTVDSLAVGDSCHHKEQKP
ncbi:hypothetical protein LCGC14_0575700 [marine sediment metagenome]|uniref:Uncharacterized protein n=1 Tax=marine sediment metagenome TaxID=412755 RepID=A0A0F9S1F0_9ZZZZ